MPDINPTVLLGYAAAVLSLASSLYLWGRSRRAEVRLKELEVQRSQIDNTSDHIASADKMIDLVEKANEKVLSKQSEYYEKIIADLRESARREEDRYKKIIEGQNRTYEKLVRRLAQLENAVRNIGVCAYRDQCPVLSELQDVASVAADPDRADGLGRGDRTGARYDGDDTSRQFDDPGARGV